MVASDMLRVIVQLNVSFNILQNEKIDEPVPVATHFHKNKQLSQSEDKSGMTGQGWKGSPESSLVTAQQP